MAWHDLELRPSRTPPTAHSLACSRRSTPSLFAGPLSRRLSLSPVHSCAGARPRLTRASRPDAVAALSAGAVLAAFATRAATAGPSSDRRRPQLMDVELEPS